MLLNIFFKKKEVINILGFKIHSLEVISEPYKIKGIKFVDYICKCGAKSKGRVNDIKRGKIKTCGCYKNITGKKYGNLLVLEKTNERRKASGLIVYKCKCDCGNIVFRSSGYIRASKNKTSCENCCSKFNEFDKRIYDIHSKMIDRCYNPNSKAYFYYGLKGIKISDSWLSYDNFYEWAMSNGYEKTLTIDRINVNGNYSPDNCRWVDMKTQSRNKTNSRYITYKGVTLHLYEWCENLNLNKNTINNRMRLFKKYNLEIDNEKLFSKEKIKIYSEV